MGVEQHTNVRDKCPACSKPLKLTMKRKEKVVHHCTACGAIKIHWRSRDAYKKEAENIV